MALAPHAPPLDASTAFLHHTSCPRPLLRRSSNSKTRYRPGSSASTTGGVAVIERVRAWRARGRLCDHPRPCIRKSRLIAGTDQPLLNSALSAAVGCVRSPEKRNALTDLGSALGPCGEAAQITAPTAKRVSLPVWLRHLSFVKPASESPRLERTRQARRAPTAVPGTSQSRLCATPADGRIPPWQRTSTEIAQTRGSRADGSTRGSTSEWPSSFWAIARASGCVCSWLLRCPLGSSKQVLATSGPAWR